MNNTGTVTLSGTTLTTGGTNLSITAADITISSALTATGADVTIIASGGGTIGVGATAGTMSITDAELNLITAANVNIGDATVGAITVNGLTGNANITDTLTLTSGSSVTFATGASTITNNLALVADGNITGTAVGLTVGGTSSFTVSGSNTITMTNTGNSFTGGITLVSAGGAVQLTNTTASTITSATTSGGNLTLTATDITITSINAGTGDVSILGFGGITIGLGATAGGMQITDAEFQNITAANLVIGDANDGTITVDGISSSSNISGTVTLNATNTGSAVDFSNNASTFSGDLTVDAENGVNVNVDLTTNGTTTIDADSDDDGTGSLVVADSRTIDTSGNNLSISAGDFNLNTSGKLDAGAGDITIIASLGRTIAVGGSGLNMDIEDAELGNITANNLTIGASTSDNITVDGVTAGNTANISTLILDASGVGNTVIFSGTDSVFNGGLTVTAAFGISIGANVSTNGATAFNADSDDNGTGTFTIVNSSTLDSTNNNIDITAGGIAIVTASDLIDAGTGTVTIVASNLGDIGLGDTTNNCGGACNMSITGAELQSITAANLILGDTTTNTIYVDNITAANSNNIDTVTLNATAASGIVAFDTAASTFNSLVVNANAGINAAVDLTTDVGNLTIDGDSDNATSGNIAIFAGVTFTSAGSMTLDATTTGLVAQGAATLNAANGITFNDGFTSGGAGTISVDADTDNNGTGDFNLASGAAIDFSTNNNALAIIANDVDIQGTINTGTAQLSFTPSDGGTMGIGAATCGGTCGMTISGTEFQNLTVQDIQFITAASTAMYIDSLTATNTAGSTGLVQFNSGGAITVSGTTMTFNTAGTGVNGVNINAQSGDLNLDTGVTVTAGALTLRASNNSNNVLIAADLTFTAGDSIDLQKFSVGSDILAAGAATFNAGNGITIDHIFTSQSTGALSFNADSDDNGTGDFAITAGETLTTNNNDLSIIADDFNLNTTGTINAGTGDVTIVASNGGSIGVGSATGNLQITDSELNNVTAKNVNLGDGTSGTITVTSLSTGTANISNTLTITTGGLMQSGGSFGSISSNFVVVASSSIGIANITATGTSSFTVISNGFLSFSGTNNFTGAVTLAAGTGNVTITDTASLILDTVTVGGTLTVNADDGVTMTGDVTAAGTVTIDADVNTDGTGDLTINSGITLSSTNNTVSITANDLDVTSGTINAGTGDVTILVSDNGTIGVGGTSGNMTISDTELDNITAANLNIGNSSNGAVTVDGISLSTVSGTLKISSGSTVDFNNTASSFNNSLTISAGGNISQTATITVGGSSSFTNTAGNITMNDSGNNLGTGLTVSSIGNISAVTTSDLADLTMTVTPTGSSTYSITATNLTFNVTESSTVTITDVKDTTGLNFDFTTIGSGIILADNAIDVVDGNVALTANSSSITDPSGTTTANITTTGAVSLTAGTSIGSSSANGEVDIASATDLAFSVGNELYIRGDGTTTITNLDVSVKPTTAGPPMYTISNIAGLTFTMSSDTTDLTITDVSNTSAMNLSITAANGNIILDDTAIDVVSGNVTLTSTLGSINELNATAATNITTTGAVSLKGETGVGNTSTLDVENSSNLSIDTDQNFDVDTGTATLTDLTLVVDPASGTTYALTSTGLTFSMASASLDIDTFALSSSSALNFSLTLDTGDLSTTGAIDTMGGSFSATTTTGAQDYNATLMAGSLNLNSSGNITQSAAITATGITNITLSGSSTFTLTNSSNDFTGAVSMNAVTGLTHSITTTNALVFGTTSLGTALSLTVSAGGAVTQTGAISAGSSTLSLTTNAAGDVTLENVLNDFNFITIVTNSGNISYTDANEISVSTTTAGGSGDITITADKMFLFNTITATGNRVTLKSLSADQAVDLGSAGKVLFNTLELSDSELDQISASFLEIGSTTQGAFTVSSDVSPAGVTVAHLISNSTVTGTAGGIVVGDLAIEAGGDVNFTDTTTDVNNLAIDATGFDVTFYDADDLDIDTVDTVVGVKAATFTTDGPGPLTETSAIVLDDTETAEEAAEAVLVEEAVEVSDGIFLIEFSAPVTSGC
jgi:hypothetical protein